MVPVEELEDPFEREVDWAAEFLRIDRELGDMPKFDKNIVLEIREDERY